MNIEKKIIFAYEDRDSIVYLIKELMQRYHIFAFIGSLGAGKTTIITDLLRQCGVTGPITSPTFTYVNRYANQKGQKFYHFDLYRISSIEEFQEQGFDEYLHEPDSWVFIEWPEIIMPLLHQNACLVSLDYCDEPDKRVATIRCINKMHQQDS